MNKSKELQKLAEDIIEKSNKISVDLGTKLLGKELNTDKSNKNNSKESILKKWNK